MSLKTTEAATRADARLAPMPAPRDYRAARTLSGLRKNTPGLIVLVILGVLIVLPLALVLLAAFSDSVPRPGSISLGGLRRGEQHKVGDRVWVTVSPREVQILPAEVLA